MNDKPSPGPTGQFPRGRIDRLDAGELQFFVAVDRQFGIIRVSFGTPVAWLGLPSKEARELASLLIDKADELDAGRT